jgi:acyl carrier protein
LSQSIEHSGAVVRREDLMLSSPYAAPRTDTERTLERIWVSALCMDQIGVRDTYRSLGVDSLAAATIFAAIESDLQVKLPMATLLAAPTIAQLALKIDELRNESPRDNP